MSSEKSATCGAVADAQDGLKTARNRDEWPAKGQGVPLIANPAEWPLEEQSGGLRDQTGGWMTSAVFTTVA